MIDYNEKKLFFMEQKHELLKDYHNLLEKAKVISRNIPHILDDNSSFIEYIDWLKYCDTDEMQKLNRLLLALMYVENPHDMEIINKLLESVNNNNSLAKKM